MTNCEQHHELLREIDNLKQRILKLEQEKRDLELMIEISSGHADSIGSQLYQNANYDSLTGLPNRTFLTDRLNYFISKAQRYHKHFAMMFLDLDRFKYVNDNFGHQVGDYLLVAVADRLKKLLRSTDTISRLGGDEFVVLLNNPKNKNIVALVADKIIDTLQEPFLIEGHTLNISTSIGIAMYPEDGDDADILLRHADAGMYKAKQQGPGVYIFHENDTPQKVQPN